MWRVIGNPPGPLAQLAEQEPFKLLVTGSSPVRLTCAYHKYQYYYAVCFGSVGEYPYDHAEY